MICLLFWVSLRLLRFPLQQAWMRPGENEQEANSSSSISIFYSFPRLPLSFHTPNPSRPVETFLSVHAAVISEYPQVCSSPYLDEASQPASPAWPAVAKRNVSEFKSFSTSSLGVGVVSYLKKGHEDVARSQKRCVRRVGIICLW